MTQTRAKITSKAQLVLPKAVREQLGVGPGDTVVFHLDAAGVRLEKAVGDEEPFAAFHEWASDADDRAYQDL